MFNYNNILRKPFFSLPSLLIYIFQIFYEVLWSYFRVRAFNIFMEFRSINNKNKQEKTDIVRKRPRNLDDVNNKPSASNFCYTLLIPEGNQIRVCKTFWSIFCVPENTVRRLTSLLLSGKSPVDKRGSVPCSFAKKGESVLQVIDHIKSFPTRFIIYQLNLMWKSCMSYSRENIQQLILSTNITFKFLKKDFHWIW